MGLRHGAHCVPHGPALYPWRMNFGTSAGVFAFFLKPWCRKLCQKASLEHATSPGKEDTAGSCPFLSAFQSILVLLSKRGRSSLFHATIFFKGLLRERWRKGLCSEGLLLKKPLTRHTGCVCVYITRSVRRLPEGRFRSEKSSPRRMPKCKNGILGVGRGQQFCTITSSEDPD